MHKCAEMWDKIKNKSIFLVSALLIIEIVSKILGFLREIILAYYFGTGIATDAYVVAYIIPDFVTATIFTAITLAFLPIYSRKNEKKENALFFVNNCAFIILFVSVVYTVFVQINPELLLQFFCSDNETLILAGKMARVSSVCALFIGLNALFELYLQYYGYYVGNAITKLIINISNIVFVYVAVYIGDFYLAFGIFIGNILRLILLVIKAFKTGYKITLPNRVLESIREIAPMSAVIFISGVGNEVNVVIDRIIAAGFGSGSQSLIYYSFNTQRIVITLLTAAVIRFFYPKLSKAYAKNGKDGISTMFGESLNIMNMVLIPISLASVLYSNEIMRLLYFRGSFDNEALVSSSGLFMAYSIGILFTSLNTLFSRLFYSMEKEKSVLIIGLVGICINIIFSITLSRVWGLSGIAFATSISNIIVFIMYSVVIYWKEHLISVNRFRIVEFCIIIANTMLSLIISRTIINHLHYGFILFAIMWVVLYIVFSIISKKVILDRRK